MFACNNLEATNLEPILGDNRPGTGRFLCPTRTTCESGRAKPNHSAGAWSLSRSRFVSKCWLLLNDHLDAQMIMMNHGGWGFPFLKNTPYDWVIGCLEFSNFWVGHELCRWQYLGIASKPDLVLPMFCKVTIRKTRQVLTFFLGQLFNRGRSHCSSLHLAWSLQDGKLCTSSQKYPKMHGRKWRRKWRRKWLSSTHLRTPNVTGMVNRSRSNNYPNACFSIPMHTQKLPAITIRADPASHMNPEETPGCRRLWRAV